MADNAHSDPELIKTRKISFARLSAEEVRNVAGILGGLEHVEAMPGEDGSSVVVTYCIAEHKLEELESVLSAQGYRLESNLLDLIRRGLIHFTEEIQQDNIHMPLRGSTRDDRLHAIYANVYTHERKPNENAPAQPEELRNYF